MKKVKSDRFNDFTKKYYMPYFNIYNDLNEKELINLEKLNIHIKKGLYSTEEYYKIYCKLICYYDLKNNDLELSDNFKKSKVSKKEFESLLRKISNIEKQIKVFFCDKNV